ncbi:hypothetical protein GCM10025863_28020 [Microbacterium suwonense]|uniref:Uncharacterized protein n=1 Tax=Microbacterium suwonense TaxID=683047 RepID=A0ABM8FWZ8_9MICO|nr:hypothetical protein GCM10025863_28020 [Microbacterium suwonense]
MTNPAQSNEEQQSALEQFGINLTDRARQGKLDPVIGRDSEIRRVSQVLTRRTKNNPVLIGEPGVGKTAVVEGSRSASSRETSPNPSRTRNSSPWTSPPSSPVRCTAASSRSV